MQSPTFKVKTKAIRAGAGAGKTYNLTLDVVGFAKSFHEHHHRWPRVVVTTFTKKATQELSERILQKTIESEPSVLPFVNSGYYLQVSTIHGILDRLLKECGSLLGLRRDFSYCSSSEAQFLSKKTLKAILENDKDFQEVAQHYGFRDLHKLVEEAQNYYLKDLSCVNSSDLLHLLKHRIEVLKTDLMGLLDTLKQQELSDRWQSVVQTLEGLLPWLDATKWVAAHSKISELMETIALNGLKPRKAGPLLDIYDDFKDCVDRLRGLGEAYYSPEAIDLASRYNEQFEILLTRYIEAIYREKKKINKIEISDLEILSQMLIRNHREHVELYAKDFDYWVIDEFQDTSPLQLELLNVLIGSTAHYIVGDPQQSIYLFRGARSEVFHHAVDTIRKSGGEYVELIHNYRSQEKVLNIINSFSEKLGSAFSPMEPTKHENSPGPAMYLQPHCEPESELAHVLRHIRELRARGAQFKDIGILVRKNERLKQIGEYLATQKIPVHLSASGQLWKRREIYDCIIIFKFLLNPHNDNNLLALLRSPFVPLLDEQIVKYCQTQKGSLWASMLQNANEPAVVLLQTLLEATKEQGYVYAFLNALKSFKFMEQQLIYDPSGRSEGNVWLFVHKLRNFEATSDQSYFDFITDCERAEFLEPASDAPGAVDNDKVSIMTIHAAKGLQFEHVLLPLFKDEIYLENKIDFLVDEVQKKWCIRTPLNTRDLSTGSSLYEKHILAYFKQRLLEEDKRLFYVAITRAIQSLYVSWPQDVKKLSWSHLFSDFELSEGDYSFGNSTYKVYGESAAESVITLTQEQQVVVPPVFQEIQRASLATAVTDMISTQNFKQTSKNFYKIRLGILFHRLLEVLAKPVEIDLRQTLMSWFGEDAESVAEALNYILQLKDPPMTELLKSGYPEWGFIENFEGAPIQGQIDLWGIVDNVLWIVDYKSGGTIQEQKVIHQLSSYAKALKHHLQWQGVIQVAVVYPFSQKTIVRDLQ